MITPYDSLRYYLRMLNAGLLAVEQNQVKIKAWVGGIDYSHFKYDHVRAKRQVGSTFKPIVMAAGLQQGLTRVIILQMIISYLHSTKIGSLITAMGNTGLLFHGRYFGQFSQLCRCRRNHPDRSGQCSQPGKNLEFNLILQAVPSFALGTADISLLKWYRHSVFCQSGKNKNYIISNELKITGGVMF